MPRELLECEPDELVYDTQTTGITDHQQGQLVAADVASHASAILLSSDHQ